MFCSHLLTLFLQSIVNQLFLRMTQCERCQSVIFFSESHSESVCFIHVYLFFCLIDIQLTTSDLLTFYFFTEEAFFHSRHRRCLFTSRKWKWWQHQHCWTSRRDEFAWDIDVEHRDRCCHVLHERFNLLRCCLQEKHYCFKLIYHLIHCCIAKLCYYRRIEELVWHCRSLDLIFVHKLAEIIEILDYDQEFQQCFDRVAVDYYRVTSFLEVHETEIFRIECTLS